MTTAEVAALLGITAGTVRDAIAAGRLTARRTGRDWSVTPAAVERYRAQSLGRPGRRPGKVRHRAP